MRRGERVVGEGQLGSDVPEQVSRGRGQEDEREWEDDVVMWMVGLEQESSHHSRDFWR